MNRIQWALLSLLLVSGTAAATTTVGPFLDCDQQVAAGDHTVDTVFVDSNTGQVHHIVDHIKMDASIAVNVRGLAYVTRLDLGGLEDGNVMITTIYGQGYTPVGTGLETTGFNSVSPEISPVSGETIFGNSGTEYTSFSASGPTTLSALSSYIGDPDFDLSPFQGDPSWVVYVFRTYVPSSELAPVPEPLTMIALGMGITGLGGYIRRRRMAAK